jgi:hypothetical protein
MCLAGSGYCWSRAAELFEDGRQRRDDAQDNAQELFEQIGRLRMEGEPLKKSCRAQLSGNGSW